MSVFRARNWSEAEQARLKELAITEPITLFGLNEQVLRLAAFASAFVVFSLLEALFPRRNRRLGRLARWFTNGAMLVIATGLVRVLAFAAPLVALTAAAGFAAELGFGLLNVVTLPIWIEILLAIALLDLAVWFQHLITHKVPLLWRLHRVHHADRDFDASTALRFHPVEIALSALYKIVVVMILGPAAIAAVLFEITLNATALFNHANLALPRWLDRILRLVLVTPDMHRVHHSVHPSELNTNFGFCLSIWDRMFGTYTAQPRDGHEAMTIGLAPYQSEPTEQLRWSLFLPFSK